MSKFIFFGIILLEFYIVNSLGSLFLVFVILEDLDIFVAWNSPPSSVIVVLGLWEALGVGAKIAGIFSSSLLSVIVTSEMSHIICDEGGFIYYPPLYLFIYSPLFFV